MNAQTRITAEPPRVYAAISAVMAEVGADGIAKGRRSSGGATFSFRGIDDVYNVMSPILCKHGLTCRADQRREQAGLLDVCNG